MWCIDKILSGDVCPKGERKPDFSWLEPQQPRITALNSAMGYVGHLPEIKQQSPTIRRIIKPEHRVMLDDIWNNYLSRLENNNVSKK